MQSSIFVCIGGGEVNNLKITVKKKSDANPHKCPAFRSVHKEGSC